MDLGSLEILGPIAAILLIISAGMEYYGLKKKEKEIEALVFERRLRYRDILEMIMESLTSVDANVKSILKEDFDKLSNWKQIREEQNRQLLYLKSTMSQDDKTFENYKNLIQFTEEMLRLNRKFVKLSSDGYEEDITKEYMDLQSKVLEHLRAASKATVDLNNKLIQELTDDEQSHFF